jgi:DNA-binding transcriptional MerR regulator
MSGTAEGDEAAAAASAPAGCVTGRPAGTPEGRVFRTAQIARILGVHPNTVRQYEAWGLLSPIGRTASGYRTFTSLHLDQLKVVKAAFRFTWIQGGIKAAALEMLEHTKACRFYAALEAALRIGTYLTEERTGALAAIELVKSWTGGRRIVRSRNRYRRKESAARLGVTPETLRTWERNGLVRIPRDPRNGYRFYGEEELDRLFVIRTLRRAGYSMMAVRRMFLRLEREGRNADLADALDTPTEPEDLMCAANYWLTALETLTEQSRRLTNLLTALAAKYGDPRSSSDG